MEIKTILYIEDEEDIRTIVEISLMRGGMNPILCASGEEGLKKAQELLPDLILIDVMLPDMDGPGILKKLREIPVTQKIPAIFITARSQKHEIEAYKELGVLDVITKPFDPLTLPSRIREIYNASQ